jgi:hypothetical protein
MPLIAVSFAGGSAHQPVDAIAMMHKKVTCFMMMLLEKVGPNKNASQRQAQQDTMPGAAAGSKSKKGKNPKFRVWPRPAHANPSHLVPKPHPQPANC